MFKNVLLRFEHHLRIKIQRRVLVFAAVLKVTLVKSSLCMASPLPVRVPVSAPVAVADVPLALVVVGSSMHEFGQINLMDHVGPGIAPGRIVGANQKASTAGSIGHEPADELLGHTFILANASSKPIAISRIKTNSAIVSAKMEGVELPTVVPPGARVSLRVSLDPMKVLAGDARHTVDVLADRQKGPLVSVRVHLAVKNGVTFGTKTRDERIIHLWTGPEGVAVSRVVFLRLDPRIPQYFPPHTRLRLVATRPDLTVKLITSEPLSSQDGGRATERTNGNSIEVDDDVISFANPNALDQPCFLVYRVEISGNVVPGEFRAHLVLAADKPSAYGMLQEVSIPVRGFILDRGQVTQDLK